MEIEEGFQLVYLGKKIQREEKGEEDYNETIDEEETVDALEGDREEQEQEK